MSKSLSVASVIEKNRISSDVPFLICADIEVIDPITGVPSEVIHIVRNNENIQFNGVTYVATSFDVELREESGAQQSIRLSINDYTKALQSRLQIYGGGVGFSVAIMIVNADALNLPPEIVEYFQVTASESSNYVCSFSLGAENNLSKSFPRRRQTRDYCQWRYKQEGCEYSGSMPTCDQTLRGPNGCKAHNNVIRFGGFPGINTRDVRYG